MKPLLLQVHGLHVTFRGPDHSVYAVRGINFEVCESEIVGLVGESGSGKSALGGALLNLHDPNHTTLAASTWQLGETILLGQDERAWRQVRGRRVAMVFQDPMTALNPFRTLGSQLDEVLSIHTSLSKQERTKRCIQALQEAGLSQGRACMGAYPHALSGGMRQRAVLAMALLGEPELLVADEPTTALDVTVQAQILALVAGLCANRGMAMVMISHDLAVLAGIAERIAVMYAGEIVESGPTQSLHDGPKHPYSRALWRAMPDLNNSHTAAPEPIKGAPPYLAAPPVGCAYAPRCPQALPVCRQLNPEPQLMGPNTWVRCHNPCAPSPKPPALSSDGMRI